MTRTTTPEKPSVWIMLSAILGILFAIWFAYEQGRSSVMNHTTVSVFDADHSFGPYFGKCYVTGKYSNRILAFCATEDEK